MITMQSARAEPYITAVLTGSQTELDLSGDQPFNLSITLTLHANAPVICYAGDDNAFFRLPHALHNVGIVFTDQRTHEQIGTSQVACTGFMDEPGPGRILDSTSRLFLQPNTPVVFEIPFNGTRHKQGDSFFDLHLYMVAHGFETGGTYRAALPTDRKLSWWRWAKSWEAEDQEPESSALISGVRSTIKSAVTWFTDDQESKHRVPVLSENEQLPISIEGDGLIFSCVGKPMEWPLRTEEEERQLAEERREIRDRRRRVQAEASNAPKAE
ncbi:hypothetical protein KCU91_g5048, partial [Aureobasidium melanogenum]